MAKREIKTQNTEEVKVETVEAVIEEKKEDKKTASISKGIVADCEKLNIRKAPKKDSEVTTIIDKGSKVTIDDDKSVGDWYRVRTDKNIWGYCMKQYIKLG